VNGSQKNSKKWLLRRIIVIGKIGRKKVYRTIMAVSPMMTNHARRTPNGFLLIRMAGEHLEDSPGLYYLRVDWLNLNMHGLDHLETKVWITWEAPRNQILKTESGLVQSTCMLHPTLMRRKAHKRVRERFPVKD